MIILKCRTAERPIAGRRAFNLPQGMRARLFCRCLPLSSPEPVLAAITSRLSDATSRFGAFRTFAKLI